MDRIEFLFQATTLWFVSILTWRELYPALNGTVWLTVPFIIAFAAYYVIPAYAVWRCTEDLRERVWQRWLAFVRRR
ncbi:hypothetical protein Hrd1104_10650 [Halorhabdus sp. CBA1104]|uniref:hypothetical protein n=1 Tax=Halorhabdus sp. CBA1104 TaxID=1380432 RepID=UPI0012B33B6F|nr:hypothetical protein [Halorhabdus sp. CBA1104]QGN07712.1 hypothetical protein Hrd1104_10650 [Halorhabdus sp. CBA1104]